MKLHSPEFEQRLRRGVRQTMRESPALRKEARRIGRPRHYSLRLLVRPGLAGVLALGVWWMADQTKNPAAALAIISLWMFIWFCLRVEGVLTCLYADPELGAFSLLPIKLDDLFRWQLHKFLRASAMSLLDLFAALGAFGAIYGFNVIQWVLLLLIVLLSWIVFLALVFLCASRWPRLPYGVIPALGMFSGVVLFFGREVVAKYLVMLINQVAPVLNLLPTSWPLSLTRVILEPGQWLTLLLLIPIAGVISTVRISLARLRENYEFTEITTEEASDLIPGEVPVSASNANTPAGNPQHLGVTAIEEIILARQFFATPKWYEAGTSERLLWRWLSPREKALSEFVFPSGFIITAPWRKIFRNLMLAVLAAFVVGIASPSIRLWVLGLGLFVTICQALARILGSGQAFQPTQCSGVNIPLYAAYAIGFRELARLLFKCSFAQLPFFAFFTTICATLIAYLARWPLLEGAILGIKAGGLLLAARFITVTFAFSSGTNDTARFRIRTLALLVAVVCLGLLFLGLAAAGMFVPIASASLVPVGLMAWAFSGLAVLDAYVLFRIYGWFYHANWFDLMKAVQ